MRGSVLFAFLFIGALTFSFPAHAACSSPTGPAGSLKWFSTQFKYCDGTTWQNFGGSGSSSVVTGSYTGTGSGTQSISLGFRPKWVMVQGVNGTYDGMGFAIDGLPDSATHLRLYAGGYPNADSGNSTCQPRITSTGFDTGASPGGNDSCFNSSGLTYYYTAIGQASSGSQWVTTGSNIYFNGGNVGVGTASPQNPLHVYSTSDAALYVQEAESATTWMRAANFFAPNASGSNVLIQVGQAASSYNSGYLGFNYGSSGSTSNYLTLGIFGSDHLLNITGSGNVGIGTTSPFQALEVNGAARLSNPATTQISLQMTQYGGAADKKTWEIIQFPTGDFTIRTVNDAYTAANEAIHFTRGSGYTISNVYFPTGNVGIGTTNPSYTLHVNGTAYATGAAGALSDERHKKNIRSIRDGALALVGKLRPVTFEWKEPADRGMRGQQIGFIAQEVKSVLPHTVMIQDNEEHTENLKYNEFIPVLTKAIQELKADDDNLRREFEEYKRSHP